MARVHPKGMDVRILIAVAVAALIAVPAFAQTQPTRPSAYATAPTMPSAFATSALSPCYPSFGRRHFRSYPSFGHRHFWNSDFTTHRRRGYFNPTSPCYSGTIYPSYSAVVPFEFPRRTRLQAALQGANSLNEDQAKLRIEAKGYLNVSGLQKDSRGIWRSKATMKDGRPVAVTLDLEGNIYSELNLPSVIRIRPLGGTRK
jgi:hypothetical protein